MTNKKEEMKPHGDIRLGFVYRQVPHITLKSIANNKAIDAIWEKHEKKLASLRERLSELLRAKQTLEEWEVPREKPADWPAQAKPVLAKFWKQRLARQKEIDAAIQSKAKHELLYDKPFIERNIARVAGPFTAESLLPHRMLTANEDGEFVDPALDKQKHKHKDRRGERESGENPDFVPMILDNLRRAGVQQAHKEDKIEFSSIELWPGECIVAEGRYAAAANKEEVVEKRAAVFIGPEYGTVSRVDIAAAAREALEGGFEVLVSCAFNYDAQASDLGKMGRLPILKARMNADLHMADLKNTGKGNLFVIFGEPDVTVTAGLWLMNKKGKLLANYDPVLQASGCGSLEELNSLGKEELLARLGKAGAALAKKDELEGLIGAQLAGAKEALQGMRERDFPLSLTKEEWTQAILHGVDVYDPSKGEVRSDEVEGSPVGLWTRITMRKVSLCGRRIFWGRASLIKPCGQA